MITDPNHPFLEDKTVWVVLLNDNSTIYADDNFDNLEPASAWIRLLNYLKENNLSIIKLGLRFRDHYEWLPENKDGYYFANGAMAMIFSDKTVEYKVMGYIEDNQLICRHYTIPALLNTQTTVREVKDGIGLWKK